MLAYVFWHWPNPEINELTYQEHLLEFHKILAENPPVGFARSIVFQTNKAPWLKTDGRAFEEWYLLQNSAALDKLNEAAVSGPREAPHNLVAKEAAGGVAGLYRLRAGQGKLSDSRYATWFGKPTGLAYQDFYATLQPLSSQDGVALWSRTMTLGPTEEFCIYSQTSLELPAGVTGQTVTLKTIWAGV